MLKVQLKKRRGAFSINAAFSVDRPEVVPLFGKSGAGKTTVVKMLAGLTAPDEGSIVFKEQTFFDSSRGISLAPEARGIGYVFQEHRLFTHMTVRDNILFGPKFGGRPMDESTFDQVVALLGIESILSRHPSTLSGGEAQRVSIGRALLACTSFLLMDEPLSSLDRSRQDRILEHVKAIPKLFGIPVLYVTHSRRELSVLAREVLWFQDGESSLCSIDDGLSLREGS